MPVHRIRIHPIYGQQVEARRAVLCRPSGRMILGFLKSPACPGIGQTKAKLLWDNLGEEIYDALGDPSDPRIAQLIGDDLAITAQCAWKEHDAEVIAWRWCETQGLSVRLSRRLSAIYGAELPERMAENPYCILAFTNWKTAERLARTVQMPHDDPRRLIGAVEAIIFQRLDDGHTAISRSEMVHQVAHCLEAPAEMAGLSLDSAIAEGAVVEVGTLLAGAGAATMEQYVLEDLRRRQEQIRSQPDFLTGADQKSLHALLDKFETEETLALNADQRNAAIMAAKEPISILIGGAGTGKTTALKAIHALADAYGVPVFQAALAGRAARRMTEATVKPARTILALETALKDGLKIDGGLVVIDEASMLDLPTTYRLLRALPKSARLLLVGDPGQLPPIGFGLILHAFVENKAFPQTELHEVHRQAASTGIPAAARAIRNGKLPDFSPYRGRDSGMFLSPCEPDKFGKRLLDLKKEMPDAQIISALRDGPSGTNTLNRIFHEALTQGIPDLEGFCANEPVIWTVNDYTLDLMNGTLGTILEIYEGSLLIDFEGNRKHIARGDLDALQHAYAITVHKAQGSQFERVILPFTASKIGDRTLIYTAITRAQRQAVVLGNADAFKAAIAKPPKPSTRTVALLEGYDSMTPISSAE